PEDGAYDYQLVAQANLILANQEIEDGSMEDAQRRLDTCVDVAKRWEKAAPSPDARYWRGTAQEMRGQIFLLNGDPDMAIPALRESAAAFASLSAEYPENGPYRRELWMSRHFVGASLGGVGDAKTWNPSIGDPARAEQELRDTL